MKYKEVSNVLWKGGTKGRPMRLLIVLPTPYVVVGRKRRGYNQPGYLLTTDLVSDAGALIQAYLDRWQIEVLHRELKSGLGVGQVQAFRTKSNERVHGTQAATYALLNLAAFETVGGGRGEAFPPLQAWRRRKPPMRFSQHDLIALLRNCLLRERFFREPQVAMPTGWVLSHRETYQYS